MNASSAVTVIESQMPNRTSARVLIVDDDHVLLQTLVVSLEAGGFSVIAVDSGVKAIRLARRWRPDILLSDVLMLELDGVQTARRISTEIPECRVFLITALSWPSREVECCSGHERGFEVLRKPLHPEDLIDRLWTSLRD